MVEPMGKFLLILILMIGAIIVIWALLGLFDLAGSIVPGHTRKEFFDQ